MLKIKEIKKEGKYLTIVIKKPYFKRYKDFIQENNLIFEDKDFAVLGPRLTLSNDVEFTFLLRNCDDIKPYIKFED